MATCRRCGQRISWGTVADSGRSLPLERDLAGEYSGARDDDSHVLTVRRLAWGEQPLASEDRYAYHSCGRRKPGKQAEQQAEPHVLIL
jgi:hypothetical protein